MSVRITEDDFDIALEHEKLKSRDAGAIVTFTGTVRDLPNGGGLNAMTLEHYPGMTESEIEMIIEGTKASLFWSKEKVQITDARLMSDKIVSSLIERKCMTRKDKNRFVLIKE